MLVFHCFLLYFIFFRPGKKIGLLHVVFGLEDRGTVQLKFSPRRHLSEQVSIKEIKIKKKKTETFTYDNKVNIIF